MTKYEIIGKTVISQPAMAYTSELYHDCDITVVISQCDIIHQARISHPRQ